MVAGGEQDHAHVDEIKVVFGPVPAALMLNVVDDEQDVGRYHLGLDGREVDAVEGGVGIPVCHWVWLVLMLAWHWMMAYP